MKMSVVISVAMILMSCCYIRIQELLGEAEMAAAKKLSENEARVTELTDKWKDRWKETQKILEVGTSHTCNGPLQTQAKLPGLRMEARLPVTLF